MSCEDLKFWNKNGFQILTSQKYPQRDAHCTGLLQDSGFPHYKKATVVLAHCLMNAGTKQKVIGQLFGLFPSDFSTKLESRNWGIREVDLDSIQYNGLKSIPKFAYTGTKPATDQIWSDNYVCDTKTNSVIPFLTSVNVFSEFTNLDPCDSALWDFAGFSSPFQSTKLST